MIKDTGDRLLLSAQMVVDELEKDGLEVVLYPGRGGNSLEGIHFLSAEDQAPVSESLLYLSVDDAEDLFWLRRLHGVFLTVRPPEAEDVPEFLTLIAVKSPITKAALFNKLIGLFQRYHRWDYEVLLAVGKGDIQQLARLGSDFLENPLFIHDSNFNYLANSNWIAGQTVPTINKRTGLGMIPLDVVASLSDSSIYRKTLHTRGAHIYENFSLDSYRVLYVNLWDEGDRYLGRLCIDEMANPIRPGHFYIAEYFAGKILQTLQAQQANIQKHYNDFQTLLKQVLERRLEHMDTLREELEKVGWEERDTYLVFLIRQKGKAISDANTCYEIENHIDESCAFVQEDGICLITNLTRGAYTPEDVQTILLSLFEKTAYYMGMSNPLDQFWDLSYAAAQARLVLEMNTAQGTGRGKRLFKFADDALRIILRRGTGCLPGNFLASPCISILKQYDRENHSDFLYTLRVYLHCERNVAQAAQKLFIHRSTMAYRIERIEKLTGLKLDDADQRLYLNISFQLLDESDMKTDQNGQADENLL